MVNYIHENGLTRVELTQLHGLLATHIATMRTSLEQYARYAHNMPSIESVLHYLVSQSSINNDADFDDVWLNI